MVSIDLLFGLSTYFYIPLMCDFLSSLQETIVTYTGSFFFTPLFLSLRHC